MNDDTLMIIGSLDQPIQTNNGWVLQRIDEIIDESVEKHNAFIALNACKQLVEVSKTSGLALAKALHLTKQHWDAYDQADEFEAVAYEYLGLHKATVDRYVNVWDMFAGKNIPDELKEEIQQRNIKDLIPVAKALEQGYEIKKDTWQDIADAPDFNTVAKIVREDVKGVAPRSGSLQLYMDSTGTIWAYYNNSKYFVGSLEVDSEDEAVQKSIKRIISGAGVLEQ